MFHHASSSISDFISKLDSVRGRVNCTGLSGAERAYFLRRVYERNQSPLLVVCANLKEMEDLSEDLRFFESNSQSPVIGLQPYNGTPVKSLSYDVQPACRRIEGLYRILNSSRRPIVVTTVSGLMERLMPKSVLSTYPEYVVAGEELDRDVLIEKLVEGGYQRSTLVEELGDYAVRGALIDVFPPLSADPVRIEFDGDLVESIRLFSAQNQLSLKTIDELVLLPAVETVLSPQELPAIVDRIRHQGDRLEMPGLRVEEIVERIDRQEQFSGVGALLPLIYGNLETLFDYLPADTLPVLTGTAELEKAAREIEEKALRNYERLAEDGSLCVEPETRHMTWSEAKGKIRERRHIVFKEVSVSGEEGETFHFRVDHNDSVSQELKARKDPNALLTPLKNWIQGNEESGLTVYVICSTTNRAKRLDSLAAPYGIRLEPIGKFPAPQEDTPEGTYLTTGRLSSGFAWPDEGLAMITDEEIFGPSRRLPKAPKPVAMGEPVAFEALKAGDLVVHVDHGIGRYGGLVEMEVGGMTNDFLFIEYRDGDKLYVPSDRMNCVQKYAGVDSIEPRLDKMGGKSWSQVKERIKKSVRKMAGELLNLYAWRKVQEGYAFSPPDQAFRSFESAFEYAETPDQIRAVHDVMQDMEAITPMDRLICGDVGYGKTEIALRAAFKAVWDNKQVAFLVPTTVLAEQHVQTFASRFEPYPIRVESLSRFRSTHQQRKVTEGLQNGQVDIVIGTHRLLQKDITFKDLGLIIIDEEQRFGVAHKEKLKRLRRTVDVLALTATPIPRTLHMSLLGIRDLSVIATPPEYRYPVKTYVCVIDDMVIAEAIHRELQRGGQAFFVHNNIQTIRAMARRIEALAPSARVGVAHGRMGDDELEEVMLAFLHHDIDLLVCTSIIESGLDFPSANTILINRADRFGLSQIYQLRGRVGRGNDQAYAYLFIPHENAITREAQKRLRVLMEHSDLGSGFQIAMKDLQIRGGGTILGPTQSGQVAAVGYEMYLQLMERAIGELKGEPVQPEVEPEVIVPFSAYIPEEYIQDIDQRVTFYRRLAKVSNESEIGQIREELLDRFGTVPESVEALLEKINLKVLCKQLGISRLELRGKSMSAVFSETTPVGPEKMMALIQENPDRFHMKTDYMLQVNLPGRPDGAGVATAKKVLQQVGS